MSNSEMPHHMGCLISTSSEETTSGTWNPTSSFLFILLFDLMQAIHRHIPIIIGALGPLYPELLSIISDPPEGSENLLTQVGSFSIFFTIGMHFYLETILPSHSV